MILQETKRELRLDSASVTANHQHIPHIPLRTWVVLCLANNNRCDGTHLRCISQCGLWIPSAVLDGGFGRLAENKQVVGPSRSSAALVIFRFAVWWHEVGRQLHSARR